MKKNIFITLMAITSAFALTACAGNTPAETETTPTVSADTVSEANADTEIAAADNTEDTSANAAQESTDSDNNDTSAVTDGETATELGTDVWGITIDPTLFYGYTTEDDTVIINYIGEDAAGSSFLEFTDTEYATPEEAILAVTADMEISDLETIKINGYDMVYASVINEDTEGVQIKESFYAITWKDTTVLIDEFITLGGGDTAKCAIEDLLNNFYLTIQPATEPIDE